MRHACLALLLALAEAREFEFVSAERAGSRRSCGGAHYVPGTHSGELHAKALERRQREREEQALLEPSFLETAMVPPAMQMPPPMAIGHATRTGTLSSAPPKKTERKKQQ